MPVTSDYWNELQRLLASVRPVTHKRMFGGIGLYLGGRVFGIVDNDRLYFKVDERNVARYDEAGAEPWMYDPAVGPVAKYREVPQSVLEDPAVLGEWIDQSCEAAERLAAASQSRKRRAR